MLFRLENRSSGQATHTGVLEFIAEEGMVYVPYWVITFTSCHANTLEVNLLFSCAPSDYFASI